MISHLLNSGHSFMQQVCLEEIRQLEEKRDMYVVEQLIKLEMKDTPVHFPTSQTSEGHPFYTRSLYKTKLVQMCPLGEWYRIFFR